MLMTENGDEGNRKKENLSIIRHNNNKLEFFFNPLMFKIHKYINILQYINTFNNIYII